MRIAAVERIGGAPLRYIEYAAGLVLQPRSAVGVTIDEKLQQCPERKSL